MNTDEKPERAHEFDELYAIDGGSDPDSDYPRMTQYQVERLRDLITESEFAYEEHPIEAWPEGATNAGERVEAAEKAIFDFVSLLLAERDAEIKRLKAPTDREQIYKAALIRILNARSITAMTEIAQNALQKGSDS